MDAGAGVTDEALAAQAASGDEPAFEQLVGRYHGRAYRLAARLVGDDDALDVTQEALLAVYRDVRSFRGDARFSTWFYRVVTNAALMHRRARGRRPAESLDTYLPSFDEAGVHRPTPEQLRVVVDAEAAIDQRALARLATVALEQLPEHYRTPFVLRDCEDLTTAEVAAILHLEVATVRQRVHRARLLLRGLLTAMVQETR